MSTVLLCLEEEPYYLPDETTGTFQPSRDFLVENHGSLPKPPFPLGASSSFPGQ